MFTIIKLNKLITFSLIFVLIAVATGCTKTDPAEEIYRHLEKAVTLEGGFEQQQKPLSDAENEEYELYEQILSLSDLEEIQSLAAQAEESATLRKSMLEKEFESINQAYDEFNLIKPLVETIESEEIQNQANQLLETMQQRYDTYLELYNEYKVAISLDIELYQLVQKEDLTIEELEEQHEKVNGVYEVVNGLKDQFNEYTIKYNEEKRAFYELAQLEVVYN